MVLAMQLTSFSEFRVQTRSDYGNRAPIAVVGGISDELVIGSEPKVFGERQAIIGLNDLFEARMR